LPTEEPPTSSTNPPRCAAAASRARTPNSAASASRGMYSGRTSSGIPDTLIAACTPSRRGSASLTRTPPGGPLSGSLCDDDELIPSSASLVMTRSANCPGA
jgi:hypothetical protein